MYLNILILSNIVLISLKKFYKYKINRLNIINICIFSIVDPLSLNTNHQQYVI